MALFAVSDLHLGKNMDVFGAQWEHHQIKIAENWQKTVKDSDTVIISGDVSWAKRLDDALPDLEFINSLPGNKVIHSGNHDYWWDSTQKLNSLFKSIFFLKNNYFVYMDYAICGSRGWICPGDTRFTPSDEKVYRRELKRAERSFEKAVCDGYRKFILSLHFPPVNDKLERSGFSELIAKYKPGITIYGHLHSVSEEALLPYKLVSADYLDFTPCRLI